MADTPADPLIVATWERLLRFQRVTIKAMDDNLQTTFGRSLDDYDILHQLMDHGEPMRMGELAESLLVANSSCNRLVGRLVGDGLVVRSQGKVDRREVFVAPTTDGRRLYRRMARTHGRDIQRVLGEPLSTKSVRALSHILDQLTPAEGDH